MLATFGHPRATDVIMSGGENLSMAMEVQRSMDREDNSNSSHSKLLANGRPSSTNITGGRSPSPGRDADERRRSYCSSPAEDTFPANNNTTLHDKVSSMWKEKYGDSTTSDPAGSVDSALDMDDDDNDISPVALTTNGHHRMVDETAEGVNRSPTGKFCRTNGGSGGALNNGLPDDDLPGSGLSRHHLGSLMRSDMVSCETSKLLRGILQGKGKGLADPSDLGLGEGGMHTPDSGLISQLLQRERGGRALIRDTSYDGEMDSVHSATPGDSSSDEMSDQENQGTHDNTLNGADLDRQRSKDDASSTGSTGESVEAKRARIENIIGTMRVSPNRSGPGDNAASLEKRHKRKQFVPQQHDVAGSESDEPATKVRKTEREVLRNQLREMQQQLAQMQDRYVQLFDGESADQADLAELSELNLCRGPAESDQSKESRPSHATSNIIHSIERLVGSSNDDKKEKRSTSSTVLAENQDLDPSNFIRQAEKLVKEQELAASKKSLPASTEGAAVLNDLAKVLKEEISHSVGSLVDTIVARFARSQQPKNKVTDSKSNRYLSDAVKEIQKMAKSSPTPPSSSHPSQHQHSSSEDRHLKEQQHQQQLHHQHQQQQQHQHQQRMSPVVIKPTRTKVTDKILHPMLDTPLKMFSEMPRPHLFPPPSYYAAQMSHLPHLYGLQPPPPKEPEQTEAMSLVVNTPKKKRTKVTDTRLSPRAAKALLQEGMPPHALSDAEKYPPEKMPSQHIPHHPLASPHHPPHLHPLSPEAAAAAYHASLVPVSLPTSVAIPNPGLQHSDVLAMYSHGEHGGFTESSRSSSHSPAMGDHGSPNMAHTPSEGLGLSMIKGEGDSLYDHHSHSFTDSPSNYDGSSMPQTVTLTPMHLRKAKLMFFFLRYPSSAILKIYFPDVKFNKNNTAQLVKWFSNFREFYYIQMEKYARQALAEGVTNPEDITVTSESEIYRVLNLHYNRNNQIEVPDNFRIVVQATLREFFKSIQAGKDQEQSWKKAIYKIIARMDDALPEFFKSPNWMEQLNDM